MAERPLYTLYKNLKAQNYDVPNDYNKFENALTRDGKSGANNRHAIYENLKAQNFDVPDTYERFYTALFEPRSKTSSRAKGGSVPMSAADRARFSAGAAAISASAKQIANNAGRYNRLKQRKQKQQKDFGRVNLGTHLTPFGGDANDVVKDEFAYNPETGKAGAYVTSDNENAYTQSDAEQRQAILDKYGEEWNKAVDMGMVPSELDKADPGLSDTDVAMRQMERRQEWLDENQNRRSQELNESMHLQDSPFVASGGAVAPSSFNAAIGSEANRLSDAEYGAYNTAKAYNQMLRTTLLQELKEQKQRNEDAGWWKDKWNDVSNYFGAMFNTMLDPKLYSQGVMDAAIASNLRQVKKGMEDGTIKKGSNAGNAAQVMLGAIQQQQAESAKQQQYGTKAYQYGDVSGRSLKFMGDFALSGWRDVMTTGFTKAGEKVGEKMALGALGKWFTKNTGRVLGDMAGSAALAATNQLGSTYNNVIERYVGMNNENGGVAQDKDGDLSFNKGVSLGKAIKDGFGSATIENFSEMFGEYLPGASKLLSKLGLSKVSSFFEKIGNNAYYKWLSNATNKSGIQGVMAEISEEEFGTALHAAWGDGDGSWSDFNVFTNPDAREKQIDTCLGMFYSVGFMQSPRTAVGAINAVKYFSIKLQVTKADKFGQMMFNDKWDDVKSKIDVTTNADLTKTVLDATRSDSMTAKQKGAVINYAMFLSKLRGFNQASDAKTKDKVEEGETAPTLSNYLDDAYTEGHNADDADKHDIQIQHEDQAKTLAAALNISEQQLSGMSEEELESLTGQDDKLDKAIYDYQLSSARYQGVVDDAQDKVDLAAHQAEQRVNMYTDQSRGSVRNATIKASGGAEDYGVYIISGNIATHDDGSIDVSNSDDMILYFDPTTNSVEHADALMFAELGEELPADAVKAQAVADAKENAIKEVAGIIDGTVDVGSQFSVTDADGTEHTYEVLADNGDGTAMVTIDGNVPTELVKGENVQIPYSFEDLQKMKDLEDQKRLEAAKTEREQIEKERAGQQTQETEDSQPSFDFNQILNDNGNVVLVDVLGKDGNTKYPGSKLFLIRDAGAKAKVVELKSDGTIVPHAVNKEDVATISTMTLDEYKQAMPSSMIEDNSGENRGEIEEETPTIEGETAGSAEETAAPESAEDSATEQTPNAEQTPAITLEDGTIVPMLEDGNPDFSKLSAAQTAELYDTQFDEDADGIVSGYVSDAKKALDKANNMTVKGKTFVEQKAAKAAKEKSIADAQAAYDSAVAIRDAYNERQLAKEENTPEGRKSLIEKAKRKFARLKNSEEWSERPGDLWNETVGKLLHRLYDATGIDVFNDTPNTVYEYVAANVGPYSLNYEGNDNSKGVQQETGLSRSDFAKLGWLAAEGKGMTIDAKVHRLWENRPSNLESADTQEIRNALISLITSGQTAFQARDYILNQRIELAESALEEQLRQEEDAAEAQRVKEEEEKKKAELEKKKAEEEKTNENRNAPELSHEQQKAMEEGEKLGFPTVDKEGEPINQNVIELANWAKEQGLEIDPTSKLNSYADLYVMCKDGFGVSTLVPDVGENINQVFYFPENVQGEQLLKLQEEFNVGRDLKHSADMNSELTEGAMFYDGDTAREFKEFVDKKVEMQNKVFGEQRPEEDLPFSAKDNGQQQTATERDADVERNKVDDMKVVDNIVGQKTRKTLEKLAKMMGANVQWQYSDKNANGWFDDKTNTIYLTLDSSITEGVQFIFGHEMTHEMRTKNPAAYDELKTLVKDMMGEDAFNSETDRITSLYNENNVFYNGGRTAYEEEVVADQLGKWIRDANYAHTLLLKMSHPLLAKLHEIVNKFLMALRGIEISDDMNLILRSIEQAYIKTAKGEVTNSETGEDVSFSLRLKDAIEETETNPSDAQKESGNYKKGHIKFGGYDYTIENPKGSTRSGKDANGKEWKITMHDTYGYIRGKFGKDGDHLDMFINDKADLDSWDGDVFVVDQVNPDGSFDEHKVMYGYDSMNDAEKAYLANYSKGWQGLGNITGASKAEFDKWLDTSNRKLKPFADYAKVKFSQAQSVSEPRYSLKDIKPIGVGAFGNIYNQFRGKSKAAIEFLKKLGSGEATAALHHHTIGDISLVWGDKKTGLDKILRKHPEVVDNLQSIIDSMEVVQESDNRIKLESPTHFAVVSKEYKGEPREQWLLTAYEKRESLENDKSMDTATSSLGGDTALSQSKGSAAKIDNSSETTKENGEKFSLKDDEYLKAVENGDMEKAQKMVNEAAEAAGYSTDSSYQGTSAFNGAAPWGNGYFLTKDERKEAWDNGEFEGESTLGDYINDDIDGGNLEELTNAASYRAADPMRKEAIGNVRNAIQKKAKTITMYRSVPSDVKEGSFRNGDWVTPSRAYAVDNAKLHGWGDDYNIIEQKVPVDDVWFDGNDIAEWGYGREEDYVNDTDFAYKNTKNNRKLLDAVTYDDNGNVIPLSQRFNENNADVRYSLKDEKTMFGMHNISIDKLRKAIKQGGFAAPSMGVVDSKNGIYSGYGEITLIPKAEKIAKRTGKNIGTYAADAWTPIYPPVEKKFGGNGSDVAYNDIESVPKEMQRLTRNAINSFMDGREANGLAYLYLQDKGKTLELVHVEGKYPKKLHDEVKSILGKLDGIYSTTDEQKEELLDLFIREVYDGNREEFDNDIKKFIRKDEEFIKKRPNSNIAKNKQLDVDWMKEHGYDYGALSRFVDGILRDAETSGKVDENATMKAAQQYIQDNSMKEDFDSWKEKLNDRYNVEEVIFAGYKPDGNRKYLPNTVENAVKVMKQDGKNASVGSASFSHFVASILKPMGTLDQIRKKKGNLTGNYEDVEKFQEKWQPVYDELADKMQPDAEPFESYGMDRLEEAATQKNPKKYAKDEYGVDLTDEDIDKLNELIDAVKNEKPSIYFETKFMRPYGLDEFEKAIVPNDTPSDVVDALKMAGIDVSIYERGNAEDRQKVTMDAINSSGNIRFSLKSMMAKPEGWKQANKKAIHIAEAIERDPKFSLKNLDGTLIKAGTYFSGGGLVEEGLKGIIDPVVAVEYDEKISGVYRNNFGQHIVTADVRDVDPRELVKQIDGEVEYFHASPVCKNYSQAKSNHTEVELDKETAASTAEFINAIKPKVVTIENVKGYKDSEAMKTITDALDANGYTWDADVYNAADYGGYTNRERLIVRAVRDGKLPEKPKKMARKSGWYEAVEDIIPTLTEKKNGVAPWMDIRLKADGIDWRNIDKPLYVMGSAYADGKIPHAFADELLPTLRTKSGDVIVMPDGKVYRAMGRVLARVSGVSDDYKMPFSENLSHTIIGNGIPTQLTEHVIAPLLQNTLRPTTPDDGNTRFSLRYDQFEHDLNQWKKDNNLPKDAKRPTIPQRNVGESAVDFLKRVDEYRKQMALWKTAPTYEQHLLSDDTALGEFNRELQRGSVLKRIAFQDSMLAIRKAQEAIMKEVGVDRLNMAEDAYTAENRSHGKGKNEFEEYNNEFLQPLRKVYHQMKKVLGDSYDNVRLYMMAKHGLERDAQMAFKKSLEADYEDVAQRSAAYRAYKGDIDRIVNDTDLELGRVDFTTWRQRDNALRTKYSPSYMNFRYDKMGIAFDYSGLSALFDGSDFEEAAHKLVRDIESKHIVETKELWDATNAATKKILRDGYKAGMMSEDTYQYVRDMYSHYIPLRGWDGTTADQVWDYIGGGKGAFNQTLKKAHGRTSIADDPIAYIENMAESGILLNNKNWVKQHLMLLAQNHPTSLLTLSKAWYVKSVDDNGNEEWIPATPQITSQMNSNQVKAAIEAFEQKMEQMEQTGDATQKRDGLNIAYPQTHSEEREHEVRVMKDGEEYVIYVNGDPQLAQAMNNTRAHRVREIQSGKLDRAAAWLGRKMAAAYTSLSPLFIPSNYFRDLTMTLASTAIREDGRYNYLLRKNLATSWNLGFMLRDYQSGKLREKVSNGNATKKEQMFYDFMMNGGETGFVSSLDVEDLKKKFKNDLKDLDRWKANPVKVGHTIMDSIEFLNRAIEDSNRFAIYMTSIQYGRSIDEAVNDAKDVTLNFNRKGTGEYGWQMIRNLYLFINPAVQSLQTLGALAKHHPFKFTAVTASWLASGVLVPIVNAALMQIAAAFGGGDGDDKKWYKDISKKYWQFTKWDRRNNLIMWVPFTHEYVKIPLAQEFRAFYGVGDMIASKMMGGELAEESWSQYAEDLLGQVVDMLPLDPTGYDGNIAVSLMPNAIRPVFELAFNVDFTGKPIFKDTEYNKYDPNFTKAYVGTPDWLVRVSKMVNSIGNDYPDVQQNAIDAFGDPRYNLNNPSVVDHVLSSYLGGAYTMGSQVLGLLTKSLNDPKEIKVADIPLFSKFVSNPDDRPVAKKQGDEFWGMKENYDRAANTLSKLKKQVKVDGDYSMLERFYGSEEYKQYKQDDAKVKKYEEDKKKERAEESGEEYRPHQINAEDIYNNHATPMDEFEDMKLKQLYTKLNGFKSTYDLLVDTAPSQSDGYYNTNKAAIDAIDEISFDKQKISELKKGFLDDGKDAYNAEDMKRIRELRKKVLAVLDKANKVVVANQKAKKK